MKPIEVHKTDDYSVFKQTRGNRFINEDHLKKLIASVAHKNMLPSNPILVNDKMEIIDGQHRLEVARRLRLPIYYIISSGADLSDVQRLNTHVRVWKTEDYLNSHIERGNEEYTTLKGFIDRFGFPVTVSLRMLTGMTGSDSLMSQFRTGTFEVTHINQANALADAITQMKEFTEGPAWKSKGFVAAVHHTLELVPLGRLLHKLKLSGITIRHQSGVKGYLRVLEEVVNFNAREDQKVRLF